MDRADQVLHDLVTDKISKLPLKPTDEEINKPKEESNTSEIITQKTEEEKDIKRKERQIFGKD